GNTAAFLSIPAHGIVLDGHYRTAYHRKLGFGCLRGAEPSLGPFTPLRPQWSEGFFHGFQGPLTEGMAWNFRTKRCSAPIADKILSSRPESRNSTSAKGSRRSQSVESRAARLVRHGARMGAAATDRAPTVEAGGRAAMWTEIGRRGSAKCSMRRARSAAHPRVSHFDPWPAARSTVAIVTRNTEAKDTDIWET